MATIQSLTNSDKHAHTQEARNVEQTVSTKKKKSSRRDSQAVVYGPRRIMAIVQMHSTEETDQRRHDTEEMDNCCSEKAQQ